MVERHAQLRWVRALTLASVMLAAALSGHVAAGGTTPGALLGPLLIVVSLAVAPFLGAPASALRVVVLVVVAQAGLHVALALTGRTPTAEAAPMTMGATHTMPNAVEVAPAHLSMLTAHAAAALVVALWLAAGERAAWSLVAVVSLSLAEWWQVVRYLVTPPLAVVPVRRTTGLAWSSPVAVTFSVWDGHGGLARRGPPYTCAS